MLMNTCVNSSLLRVSINEPCHGCTSHACLVIVCPCLESYHFTAVRPARAGKTPLAESHRELCQNPSLWVSTRLLTTQPRRHAILKGETEAAGDLPPHQGSVSLSDFSFLPLLVVKLPPSALLASTFDFSASRIFSSSAV